MAEFIEHRATGGHRVRDDIALLVIEFPQDSQVAVPSASAAEEVKR